MALLHCPECGNRVSSAAASCPHCGFPIQQRIATSGNFATSQQQPVVHVQVHAPTQKWSPGLAAFLSFLIPGLGQLYKGQVLNGIVWFIFVVFGYAAFIVPGLILHILCIVGAAKGDPYRNAS